MKSLGCLLAAAVLFLHICGCYGVKVDKVYLYNETAWVGSSPVQVFCDVTTEGDEKVAEVQWRLQDQLVYHWLNDENNTITVFGLLEGRVELPRNRSDWNLKINRIALELEGNFSCKVLSDNKSNDTGVLPFIINCEYNLLPMRLLSDDVTHMGSDHDRVKFKMDAPDVNKREWTSECQALATLTYPRVYPRPIVAVCSMEHKPTSLTLKLESQVKETRNEDGTWEFTFQTSANFSYYPEGSTMRCFRYVYGEEIEMINWIPEEEKDCPALNPIPSHPYYELTDQLMMPPCRIGVMAGSFLGYTCTKKMTVTLNNTCQVSGTWSVDLNQGDNWPTCGAGQLITSRWNLLFCVFFMSLFL